MFRREKNMICICESSSLIQKYITNAIRLRSKSAKPKLLKISVSSIQDKAQILQNCTKLWNKDFPKDILLYLI